MNLSATDNQIEWIETEVVKGSKRTKQVHGIRKSIARMQLSADQVQASRDIDRAFDDLDKGYGYALLGMKTPNLNGVKGGEISEEVIDAARKRLGRLHEWQFQLAKVGLKKCVMAVEAINQRGHTSRTYAALTGFDHETISAWYKRGLEEWVKLYF